MDDHTRPDLLRLQAAELTGRTPFCPEDQEIAEYFEGVSTAVERIKLENHLVNCRFCLARIGMLQRQQDDSGGSRVPEEVLATAKAMRHRPPRGFRWAPAWATAAAIFVAVGLFFRFGVLAPIGHDVLPRVHQTESISVSRETRWIDPAELGPRFLAPERGLTIASGDGVFRWTAVPNSRYYQLRIVSDKGDLLWQERVDGTEWKLPASLMLSPGAEYFVRVDAFLSEAQALQSDYLLFRVSEGG